MVNTAEQYSLYKFSHDDSHTVARDSILSEVILSPAFYTTAFTSIRHLVLNSVNSVHSRRVYAKAIDDFAEWYAREPVGRF